MSQAETGEKLDRSRIPQIIFDQQPGYVELYNKAWELAAEHGSIEAVAGSDAHRPEDVWGNLDDAIALGSRFGFTMQNCNIARRIIARRESRQK